jgi:PAS domain S-box-containing protein
MTKFQRRSIYLSALITILFLLYKYSLTSGILIHSRYTDLFEVIYFITTSVITFKLFHDLITRNRKYEQNQLSSKKFNEVLLNQSYNPDYYSGDINQAAKTMTREAVETLNSDRCSIWLFNKSKSSISCVELYVKSELLWYQDIKLYKKDYKAYFDYIEDNPIIIADNAETHPATECFTESYLRPLGIKSMLDVPIIFKGNVIGVVCIESLDQRNWATEELNFAQMLSSFFSFSYSIKENLKLNDQFEKFDSFVDYSVLISRTDRQGKITYVNNKFEQVSGYSLEEVLGKDHKILNSGRHNRDYWTNMYKVVVKDKLIWNDIVTNKNKDGELYWVDSYIKGEFDNNGKLTGFVSLRYDVTDLVKKSHEIEKKNTYLEHAAKIIRHDMHSGINTYIPRGVNSLERRLKPEDIQNLKIEAPLKMIREGLVHTQKVYKGVYEFTNLVKKDAVFHTSPCDLKEILVNYLNSTSYKSQVLISDLVTTNVNESLFCTAVDNLIRNGLKYNDSDTKFVKIFMESDNTIIIQDNGRGMSQLDFEYLSRPYVRKEGQKESGTGLGLNICLAIMEEHGFELTCEKNNIGTKMKIKIK